MHAHNMILPSPLHLRGYTVHANTFEDGWQQQKARGKEAKKRQDFVVQDETRSKHFNNFRV